MSGLDWSPAERARAKDVIARVIGLRLAGERAATAAVVVAEHARALRAAGVSWALIGEALGISRQAAQQRFGAK